MSIVETGQAGDIFPGVEVCQKDFESSLRIGTEPEQLSFFNKLFHSSVIDLRPLGDQLLRICGNLQKIAKTFLHPRPSLQTRREDSSLF